VHRLSLVIAMSLVMAMSLATACGGSGSAAGSSSTSSSSSSSSSAEAGGSSGGDEFQLSTSDTADEARGDHPSEITATPTHAAMRLFVVDPDT
jgi:hypothetical protein